MARGGAADARVGFVFSRVTAQLHQSAASAPETAANIFTSNAVLFRNRILGTNALAGSTETVNAPNSKQGTSNGLENGNDWGQGS